LRLPLTLRVATQAPVVEEVLFRGCLAPVLLAGGFSTTAVVFATPVFFGLGECRVHERVPSLLPACRCDVVVTWRAWLASLLQRMCTTWWCPSAAAFPSSLR
jgi:hypothetical protein